MGSAISLSESTAGPLQLVNNIGSASQDEAFEHTWSLGEHDIDWSSDSTGKIEQLKKRYKLGLLPEAERYAREISEKRSAIAALEAENSQKIQDSAKKAYSSLESVVAALLLIEKGDRLLSRQSSTIIKALDSTAASFSDLSKVSEENMLKLGVKSGDCIELGDSTGRFVSGLESKAVELNNLVPIVLQTKSTHDHILNDKRIREGELRDHLSSAEASVGDFGNNFIGFFDPSVMRNAEARLQDARRAIEDNRQEQEAALWSSRRFYQLAMAVRNVSAAICGLKVTVADLAAKFDAEYGSVTDKQDAENRLYRGLLELRNHIVSGDWTTTRDHSLNVVLKLLAADDEVFQRNPVYEDVEVRIRAQIEAELGAGAVQKLIDGVPLRVEEPDAALGY